MNIMKFKTSLRESILSNMDDIIDSGDKQIKESIKQFLKENLVNGVSSIKISDKPNKDGKYEVSSKGTVIYKNSVYLTSLTNDLFIWNTVDEHFFCAACKGLTSLKGAPKKVGRDFSCSYCDLLQTLEGAPKIVGRDFSCNACKGLTSLKGAPKDVGGEFYCSYCDSLQTLEGAPKKVVGDFNCNACKGLTSLEGAPKTVEGDFNCSNCTKLISLEGAPKTVGKEFICRNCGKQFTKDDIKSLKSLCNVKNGIYV